MTVCPRCGTLFVGRDPDKDQMRERITELEVKLGHEKESGAIANVQWSLWMAKARDLLRDLEQAEAERRAPTFNWTCPTCGAVLPSSESHCPCREDQWSTP